MNSKTKSKTAHNSVRTAFTRVSKLHVLLGIVFAIQVIIYDASKLITPDVVLKRWLVISSLIVASGVCWYFARLNDNPKVIYNLARILIAADLLVASFYVYTQRGMASRAVILFILPILAAATLQRKGLIYLTTLLSVVVYTSTAIAYFVLNFNEGYKVELYGEIGFYSALLVIIGAISWSLVRHKR